MKARMVLSGSLLLALALSPLATVGAQQAKSAKAGPTAAGSAKLTGCLRMSGTNQYTLTADDGKTYQVTWSGSGDNLLSWHVGHHVTVTGTETKDDPMHVNVKTVDMLQSYCG